ncbi:hypothetical protein CC78DRAFT_565168 [Lojkania enalia]|uniref:Uncharacterized protein n=1 Tax=Lojkania enalia TaxID=147567 RepID=A0A9P4KI18_9PLEO|nr:hypothetical protein CC78DRAFT_565168 [Didymosphaeria enalia]
MSPRARAQAQAHGHIIARQSGESTFSSTATLSTTVSAPSTSQPTTVVPLTTTFTPPASCLENRLSQLPPPGFLIWANEPVPAQNMTRHDCYPSEFLRDYRSVTSGDIGSSVVPPMSPLVCPSHYCTLYAGSNNYVACCPSGYQFHRPDNTIDPNRPGYGGTCYSDFTVGSTYTVTAFNVSGDTNVAIWIASTRDEQAYAHPIDGFAASPPTLGCPAPHSQGLSRATIAGASIGAISGLISLISLVWALLRYTRYRHPPPPQPDLKIEHVDHDSIRTHDSTMYEKDSRWTVVELGNSETDGTWSDWKIKANDGCGPFEICGDSVPELEAEGDLEKQRNMENAKGI